MIACTASDESSERSTARPTRPHAALTRRFTAAAVCSGPASDALDVGTLVTTEANRWSADGQPTLYVAGDVGTALAEVGRHWEPRTRRLGLWQVEVQLGAAVDLRRRDVRASLGIPDDPRWFLDAGRCRDMAARIRDGGGEGLIVPSVALLDDGTRWNAVVFVERIPRLDLAVRVVRAVGDVTARA